MADTTPQSTFRGLPLASYITGCVVVCDGGQNLPGSALFNMSAEKMLRAEQSCG